MEDIDRLLASLSLRRKGIIVREEALAEGISEPTLDNRVRAGILIVLYDGIYRHAAVPFTQDLRDLAAVLACGTDAVLSHRAGARLQGYPRVKRRRPEVTTPHCDLPRVSGIDVHRAVRLRPFERTVVRGIPVTTKGKTALDLCAVTSFSFASEVIAEAVITKIVSPLDIISTLERSTGRGVRGTRALRTIALGLDELRDLESVLELHGARVIELADVPPPERQFPLVCADGRQVRFDLAWPAFKLGLDWDGKRWHGTPARRRQTRERHESILASGWGHLAYGWSDVHDTPRDVRSEVEWTLGERIRGAA